MNDIKILLRLGMVLTLLCAGGGGAESSAATSSSAPLSFPLFERRQLANAIFEQRGPFKTRVYKPAELPDHQIYAPLDLRSHSERFPVIAWGNGTGAWTIVYRALLSHLASHGFIVVAPNSTQTGSGEDMLDGVRWVFKEDQRPTSLFFERVLTTGAGATGHSQGGKGALNAGNDPIIVTTAPIQPASTFAGGGARLQLQGPTFMIAGGSDDTVPPHTVAAQFDQVQVGALLGVMKGATHWAPLGFAPGIRGYVTAWFRWQLGHDPRAQQVFVGPNCGICVDDRWQVRRKGLVKRR